MLTHVSTGNSIPLDDPKAVEALRNARGVFKNEEIEAAESIVIDLENESVETQTTFIEAKPDDKGEFLEVDKRLVVNGDKDNAGVVKFRYKVLNINGKEYEVILDSATTVLINGKAYTYRAGHKAIWNDKKEPKWQTIKR